MASSSIFTRKRMGLDNSVWLLMLTFIVLSVGLFSYTTLSTKKEAPCKSLNIFVDGRTNIENLTFKLGDQLSLRLSPVSVDDKVIWEFGDDTEKKEGASAQHVFNRESLFVVRAIVNGKCLYEKRVIIKKPEITTKDSLGVITEYIIGEEQGLAGQKMIFSTPIEAEIYEWYIENNNSYQRKYGKEISYTFRSQNKYILTLVLDKNREKKYTRTIYISNPIDETKPEKLVPDEVLDLPNKKPEVAKDTGAKKDVPPPEKPRSKFLTDEIFKSYLQNVVCGNMKASDFDRYLCEGGKTLVIVNGKGKEFTQFCAEISGKRIKIESVKAAREKDNCAISLTVSIDKKGFLKKDPCKH